jgi:hypothetical protein
MKDMDQRPFSLRLALAKIAALAELESLPRLAICVARALAFAA